MKLFLALIFSLSFSSTVIARESQAGFSRVRTCTRNEYREQYFPGTQESPGYVKSWTEIIEVPCKKSKTPWGRATYTNPIPQEVDTNDCSNGTFLGGLLGAGLTMSGTRGKDRWWAIPAGGAAGAMIGCQIDGG